MTEVLILFLLILLNALFVMTEMALVSVRKAKLEGLKNKLGRNGSSPDAHISTVANDVTYGG